MQAPTDTAFAPPLGRELHDVPTRLRARRMTVVIEPRQLGRGGYRKRLPEFLDGCVAEAMARGRKDDPAQFLIVKPAGEPFEPRECVDDLLRHARLVSERDHLDGLRDEAAPALVRKASLE